VFGWPDPNTGFDQSEHALYTCYFIILVYQGLLDYQGLLVYQGLLDYQGLLVYQGLLT
jgi:hypothetical protein